MQLLLEQIDWMHVRATHPTIMKPNLRVSFLLSRRILAVGFLGISFALLSGCKAVTAGANAGAEAVAYIRGELEATLPYDYSKVVDSARAALKDLEFTTVSDKKDALTAELVARTALDKKVRITLASSGKQLTTIRIRVDFFGDEQLSNTILAKVKAGL